MASGTEVVCIPEKLASEARRRGIDLESRIIRIIYSRPRSRPW